jgi:methyl-accepting chemotaxis protein
MNKLSLRKKLFIPLVLIWFGLLAQTMFDALQARTAAYAARRQSLHDVIEIAVTVTGDLEARGAKGELTEQAAQAQAIARVAAMRYEDGTGYITIVSPDSTVIDNPMSPHINGHNMRDFRDKKGNYLYQKIASAGASAEGGGYIDYWWPRPGASDASPKLAYVQRFGPWGWDLLAGDYVDDIQREFYKTMARSAVLLLVLGAAMTVLVASISRAILRSIGGEPAHAALMASRIAAGDLSEPLRAERSGRAGAPDADVSVVGAIEHMRAQLLRIVTRIRESADAIRVAASEISAGNDNLSTRTEQQAATLEETAASLEGLTGTVKLNARNAQQAAELANGASSVALVGGQMVAQVVRRMESITESSRRIANITSVIDGIAFQTNILALNAAVEAARAGVHGRGFAVVAAEVRTLAQRSASAAKDIKALIDESLVQINDGANIVGRTGETTIEVVESVKRVTDIIAQISVASGEQSTEIAEINTAVVQVDGATQQNAALVEQAAVAAGLLDEQATRLQQEISIFKWESADTPV